MVLRPTRVMIRDARGAPRCGARTGANPADTTADGAAQLAPMLHSVGAEGDEHERVCESHGAEGVSEPPAIASEFAACCACDAAAPDRGADPFAHGAMLAAVPICNEIRPMTAAVSRI